MDLIISTLEQGMIYAIMGLGVYITYKILDFPDLTVDGSFPLGAAIGASMISHDMNPVATLFVSIAAGTVVGILTGIIHVTFKVRDLLSGVIMMTALYTVHLQVAGRANLPIYGKTTIFDNALVNGIFRGSLAPFKATVIILIVMLLAKYALDWYLSTKNGFMLRAVGDNETIVTSSGVNIGRIKIIGLAISNALVTLSGCIFAQHQRFYDAGMGPGTVVIGLASVIIGLTIFRKISFWRVTTSVIAGSIIYKACVAVAIRIGLPSSFLKLITAVLFLLILIVGMERKKRVRIEDIAGADVAADPSAAGHPEDSPENREG